jgi:4-hydroxy-4-methyl-2-oxoglutarate aldolase
MSTPEMDDSLLPRLRRLHTALICDVLDGMGVAVAFFGSAVGPLHPGIRTAGRALTLRTEVVSGPTGPPYQQLLATFPRIQPDDVLVVGGGESSMAGLWGGLLSTAAQARGAAGAVVDGLSRDVDEIQNLGFPVFARGVSPLDSSGRQEFVETGGELRVARGVVNHGDYVLGDSMGVVAFPPEAAEEAVRRAEDKHRGESTVGAELARGADVKELFDRYGVL